jgi:hypothetical protein
MDYYHKIWPPILHLPRFINEIKEHYHAIHVGFEEYHFLLSLLTHSEYVSQSKPRFSFGPVWKDNPDSIMQISGKLSTRLITIDDLRVTFNGTDANHWDFIPWRRFLLQFSSVKTLRTEGQNNYLVGRALFRDLERPDDLLALFPALEEIELGKDKLRTQESQRRDQLAVFEPLVSARQQAGRTVKVFFGP